MLRRCWRVKVHGWWQAWRQRWTWAWLAGVSCCGPAAAALDLTVTEQTWLQASIPVLRYARQQQLPLDIVVQPQDAPGEPPMGMAFVDGRCKLVLSMRGNPQAQATLDSMPPALQGPIVEAIAAHELAHCWRHLKAHWGNLPAGVQLTPLGDRLTAEQVELLNEMWRTRREEAYADMVGLAWAQQQYPHLYTEVHAWFVRLRANQAVDTGPHDTRLWVRLARDPTRFAAAASIFDQAHPLWVAGLLAEY